MSPRPGGADLGRVVRRLRHGRKLSIEALAFAADMHPTYLSGIERGKRNPTWAKITALADALDVPLTTLAHDSEMEARLAERMREARRELGIAA